MISPRLTVRSERFYSHPGDISKLVRRASFLPDGSHTLIVVDKLDLQAEINSHRSETDMSIILSRLLNGDRSMLRPGGEYGDFTRMPKTMAEMFDLVQRSEKAFNDLDLDTRRAFDNDFGKWFSKAGSPEWFKIMERYLNVPTEKSASPSAGSADAELKKE